MFIFTLNSLYEVDVDRNPNRVRRLQGVNDPTPRQGEDGVWKDLAVPFDREWAEVARVGLFVWNVTEDGVMQSTMTSVIQDMTDDLRVTTVSMQHDISGATVRLSLVPSYCDDPRSDAWPDPAGTANVNGAGS